jgi:predicted dehydrogenase
MKVPQENFKIGIIGTGAFTQFSVKAFSEVNGAVIVGAYDVDPERLDQFVEIFGCASFVSEEALLSDRDIDIIYIATPPFLHYYHSKQALLAGKHVICEKPAALKADEVEELIQIADKKRLLYVVNLMQRYNPLFEKMRSLVKSGVFGKFLHGYFENYASDESLVREHWMWDESLSGGIFLEHAVHFFDLFEGWLGPGELISSMKIKKPGYKENYYSEVQAVVRYDHGLVNFYHGFTQPSRMDRQEMKFLFELGEVVMYEWVPTQMIIRCLVTDENLGELMRLFPGADLTVIESYKNNERHFKSQFVSRTADQLVEMAIGKDAIKLSIYKNLLTDMLRDQFSWLRNNDHKRIITQENAYRSVKIAEEANDKAILI